MNNRQGNLRTAAAYSQLAAPLYDNPVNREWLYGAITNRFLQTIELQPRDRQVLDIGCGTGAAFEALGNDFERLDLHGVGVDPAEGMLARAVEKFRGQPRFEFLHGAFENIPLADQSMDRILSTLALHWASSLPVALAEMRRVLKPDGRLDILMTGHDDGLNFKKIIHSILRHYLSFQQLRQCATKVQRVTASTGAALFAAAGLPVVITEQRELLYAPVATHLHWWLARSAPIIAEVIESRRAALLQEVESALRHHCDDAGLFPLEIVSLCIQSQANAHG